MDCCKITSKNKKCIRKQDGKVFSFPRKYSKEKCLTQPIKGFTMRSSCAPFKYCSKSKVKTSKKKKRNYKINQKGGNKNQLSLNKKPLDSLLSIDNTLVYTLSTDIAILYFIIITGPN